MLFKWGLGDNIQESCVTCCYNHYVIFIHETPLICVSVPLIHMFLYILTSGNLFSTFLKKKKKKNENHRFLQENDHFSSGKFLLKKF